MQVWLDRASGRGASGKAAVAAANPPAGFTARPKAAVALVTASAALVEGRRPRGRGVATLAAFCRAAASGAAAAGTAAKGSDGRPGLSPGGQAAATWAVLRRRTATAAKAA